MAQRFATCPVRGKRCHRTLASARKTIHILAGRARIDPALGALEAYYCRHCRWFHIGHRQERQEPQGT